MARPKMNPFFAVIKQEFYSHRITVLQHAAERWIGTPWVANSEAQGLGVSCHNLPRAIYIECGALPKDFPPIVGDPTQSRHTKKSAIVDFVSSRSEFVRVDKNQLQPGDLLGLRIHKCIDHLGLVLDEYWFLHVLMHKHTCKDLIRGLPWDQRIETAWRIIQPN